MLRFIVPSLLLGAVLFAGLAWSLGLVGLPTSNTDATAGGDVPGSIDRGGDLPDYAVVDFPALDSGVGKPRAEPVIMRGTMTIRDKQDVPSMVAGQVLYIGEAVPDAAVALAGAAPFMAEPYAYNMVIVGDVNTSLYHRAYKFYRRLLPGQVVQSGQVVAMIDCSKALATLQEKTTKISYAQNDEEAAKAAAEETKQKYERERSLQRERATPVAEVLAAAAAATKFKFDHLAKGDAIKIARADLTQAHIFYDHHEIRNKIGFDRCVVQSIYKNRGDSVKEGDTVMVLHSLDHLIAEALLEGSYLDRIRPKMTATLEPTLETAPYTFRGAHKGEVTAVAVTNDPDSPRVVSAGADQIVSVRDPNAGGLPLNLRHDEPVLALACSPPRAAHNLCLAGAGGKVVVWDLARDPEAVAANANEAPTAQHKYAPVDAHVDAVTCLAFSPNGVYFASGAADGSIALWRADDGTLVYRFDADHGVEQGHSGAITALSFTPQGRLVSAARDNTVRVWQLKEKGVLAEGDPIAGRSGSVGQLGVRRDGKWLLFDQGRTLQLVALKPYGVTVNTLQNPGAATPFETFAQFSPDGALILTAGLADGRLQLWKAPTETARGYEVRQLATREKQPATCAAFFPRAGEGPKHAYAVSGNVLGDVFLWPLPSADQVRAHRIENVEVRLLSPSIDPNTSQARIAVDMPNPDGRLIPGRGVTVVIGEE